MAQNQRDRKNNLPAELPGLQEPILCPGVQTEMTPVEKLQEIGRLLTYASGAKAIATMQTPESVLDAIKAVVNE